MHYPIAELIDQNFEKEVKKMRFARQFFRMLLAFGLGFAGLDGGDRGGGWGDDDTDDGRSLW